MSSYDELLSYTKQLERRLAKLERQENNFSVAGGDHGTLSGLGDDDHSIYLLASAATNRATFAANWTDLTDAGATTLHKHDHGGMDGLGDDDHSIYLLASAATNRTTFATNWTDLTDGGATTLHVHSQYIDTGSASWIDLTDTGATTLHKHDHGGMDGLGDDDHSIYLLASGLRSAAQSGPQLFTNAVFAAGGIIGSNNANGDLTINGTSDATKTTSYILLQPSGGSVGIGTSSPAELLDVSGSVITANGNYYKSRNNAGTAVRLLGLDGSNNVYVGAIDNSGGGLQFRDNGNTGMVLSGGKVGIGTTAPGYILEIASGAKGTAGEQARLQLRTADASNQVTTAWRLIGGTTPYTVIESVEQGVAFRAICIQPDGGNVGVGTTGPEEKMHIGVGNVLVGNGYYYSGENTSGTNIRLAGIDSSNNVYLGAIDNAGAKVVIREDGSDVITLTGQSVGINTSAPDARLDVQVNSGQGINVLEVKQEDTNMGFINFSSTDVGSSGTHLVNTAAVGTYYGKIKIAVNGTYRYIPVYNS